MSSNERPAPRGAAIDAHLKRAFQEVQGEDLPNRFSDLLDKLRKSDQKTASGAGDGEGHSS